MATKPVGTFLVPDVSGEGPAAMVDAARAMAAGMGSFELLARTAVEIAGVWTVTWLITSFVRSLCSRAGRVRTLAPRHQASQQSCLSFALPEAILLALREPILHRLVL